jgi:Glycosyl hydrolase family 79 C-terminal beta domain
LTVTAQARVVRGLTCAALALAAVHLLGVWPIGFAAAAPRARASQSTLPARLTLESGTQSIPRSFFGLSVEYNELTEYEKDGPAFGRVLAVIRAQDGSRLELRIGGKSADRTFFVTKPARPVPYGRPIGEHWLKKLSALVRADRLRVMLDLNLAVHAPSVAATFAQAAVRTLPPTTLAGLEIGNEPDLYWRQPFLAKERLPQTLRSTPKNWSVNYSPADYRRDYSAYARALVAKVPRIPIGGPEIISAKPQWLSSVEGLGREDPSFLSVHRYAGSDCWPRSSPFYPTIALLLNETSSIGFGDTIADAAGFAHSDRQALRLTEVNSISCGGNPGVANSFATALWAPDALFELIRNGANSINWHIRPKAVNAPFHPTSAGIQAMPELYGLAVFADMTGPGAKILNSTLENSGALHLKAWVVRVGSSLRVLLINKGASDARVAMQLGPAGTAQVKRLQAPRVGASSGVTFGGQTIATDGRWHGKPAQTEVTGNGGAYDVTVPGYSAALVSAR